MCSPANLDRESLTDVNLENAFAKVAKAATGDGRSMNQQAAEAWLTKAQVIDGKTITQGEFASAYQKLGKPNISFAELTKLITEIATSKKLDIRVLKEKLTKAA